MNLFNKFFKKRPPSFTGALLDDRPEKEKEKDFSFAEIVSTANSVLWIEKEESDWRTFSVFNQKRATSCVAESMRKILGVLYYLKYGVFLDFSSVHIFQQRENSPGQGMRGLNVFSIAKKGVTLNVLVPSNKKNDKEIDNTPIAKHKNDVGKVFAIGGHIGPPVGDIETLASIIQTTRKAVMVWFYFTSSEWSQLVPEVKTNLSGPGDKRASRHSVAVVDFFLYKGKKAVLIEDSAHFGGLTRRIITEDFFNERNFFVRYPMNFVFDNAWLEKPSYFFTKVLDFIPLNEYGEISNEIKNEKQKIDVIVLQNILKWEKLFPSNVGSTGYYGSITRKAVYSFQKKYKVAANSELDSLLGRSVGPKTLKKLNELFK